MPGLLIAGTGSDAGKSLVTTGLVRAWSRRGVRVAPFKAQNMSNNSMVCADGGEIGRAQYLQALAAGVEPCTLHNPVLLKPGSDRRAHVVLRGQPAGELHAGEYATDRRLLRDTAFEAYDELAASVDLVVAEGAGSPTEINLRAGDFVNLGLARRFGLPVAVVGDIDRGGILAALYGTWALLDDPRDRKLLKAFIINKFRGDEAILRPGLDMVTERTGVPFAGVLPWLEEVWIDSEDTLAVGGWRDRDLEATLRIAVIRLPRTSNATDVDALAEPGVSVRVTTDAQVCRDADLLVLPGSRATVADLTWLRSRGLDSVVRDRADRRLPVLGICGGYQMLLEAIDDPVESGDGVVPGLGMLPGTAHFTPDKVLGRPRAVWRGAEVHGYEIHHGRVDDDGSFPGGIRRGAVDGTIWHGIFECDAFRRLFLFDVADRSGSAWQADPAAPDFDARRTTMIETIADAMEQHLDLDLLLDLAGQRV